MHRISQEVDVRLYLCPFKNQTHVQYDTCPEKSLVSEKSFGISEDFAIRIIEDNLSLKTVCSVCEIQCVTLLIKTFDEITIFNTPTLR